MVGVYITGPGSVQKLDSLSLTHLDQFICQLFGLVGVEDFSSPGLEIFSFILKMSAEPSDLCACHVPFSDLRPALVSYICNKCPTE